MKRLSFLLLIISFTTNAQTFEAVKTKLKDKYQYISGLTDGIATFREHNGKSGIIDSLGNVIAPANFNYIHINYNGWIEAGIMIKNQMKRGYINKDGSVKIPLIYNYIYSTSKEGLAIIELNGKKGAIDSGNNIQIPIVYDNITAANENLYIVEKNKRQAIANEKGLLITGFDFENIGRYHNSTTIVTLPNKSTSLIDINGKYHFPPINGHRIETYKDSIFTIRELKTNKYGLINRLGTFTTPCKYDNIEFSNDKFIVKLNNQYGVITANNVEISPIHYDLIISEKNNLFITKKENKYGVLNGTNKMILPFIYDYVRLINDLLIVEKESKNGVYNLEGIEIIPLEYTFHRIWKKKIFAEKENRPLILDLKTGDITFLDADILKPTQDFISEQWDKQIFMKNGKCGIISIDNEILLPAKYDDLQSIYVSGEFIVKQNKKFGIIDSKGNIRQPIEFDKIFIRKEIAELTGKNKKTIHHELKFKDYNSTIEFTDN